MRPLLNLSAALVLLLASLAGCLGSEGDASGATAAAVNDTPALNATVDDGTTEMAPDVGHMPHLHDYWMSRERATIMDDDVVVDQFSAVGFTFFNVFMGQPGVGGTFFQLPEGSLVFEGTGKMEITPTWTDPTVTGVGLRYRTPGSEDFSEVVPLTQGSPLALDITPEMTDMPHDKGSRWMFLLVPGAAGQAVVGDVHFRIDIIRVRDIAMFPGHPELFGGAHTLSLYEGAATSSSQNFATMIVGFATQNQQESGVRSGKVVPMETQTMTANVTITSSASNVGTVASVDFLYKPAGSFRSERAQVIASDPAAGTYQFAWPVEMSQTDSPYAKESQWAFDLWLHSQAAEGIEARGLADAQVEYQLSVVAYDSLLEGVEPVEDDDSEN